MLRTFNAFSEQVKEPPRENKVSNPEQKAYSVAMLYISNVKEQNFVSILFQDTKNTTAVYVDRTHDLQITIPEV
jgi:hypothetical protein